MKNQIRKMKNFISVAFFLFLAAAATFTVHATTIGGLQQQIKDHENELAGINSQIGELTQEQEILEEEIDDLNSEILNTMTSIGLKEEEISQKEQEIADKDQELVVKADEITQAEEEFDAAKKREEKQYADMVANVRFLYENGDGDYLTVFLSEDNIGDVMNNIDYVEQVYRYDQGRLQDYRDTREMVLALWNRLEEDKRNLEQERVQLEADRESLVEDQNVLKSLKANLDVQLSEMERRSANYDVEISRMRQQAAAAKKKIQQEQKELKRLQEEEARKAAAANKANNSNAAKGTYTTNYNSIIDAANGSDLGKQIAKYACQYIGNPYVSGGTSLTKGADCSGFTYRVYSDFGYRLPRTSYEQRSAGVGVNYSDAQPGDLICYSGHVAMYIGNGMIVHASSAKTGIKVGNAGYREILAVRRIIQ